MFSSPSINLKQSEPELRTLNPQSLRINLDPRPFSLQPASLHPPFITVLLLHSTLNPQPSTLDPQLSTLNPQTTQVGRPFLRMDLHRIQSVFHRVSLGIVGSVKSQQMGLFRQGPTESFNEVTFGSEFALSIFQPFEVLCR